jgi:hypothetical protein
MALSLKQSVTHAAAEGARATIGVKDNLATLTVDERESRAKTIVADGLSFLGAKYHASDTTAAVGALNANFECVALADLPGGLVPPDPVSAKLCIVVSVNYPYHDRPLVPAFGPNWATPGTVQSKAVVTL